MWCGVESILLFPICDGVTPITYGTRDACKWEPGFCPDLWETVPRALSVKSCDSSMMAATLELNPIV
jgi:hypothetical protein